MNTIGLAVLALVAAPPAAPSRLDELVEANILGTHAFQVALAKKEGKGDPACYSPGALTDLDGIHMTEPYHRRMAKKWLKLLVGAREAALPGRQ
jgi:hypothetical protein